MGCGLPTQLSVPQPENIYIFFYINKLAQHKSVLVAQMQLLQALLSAMPGKKSWKHPQTLGLCFAGDY